MKVLQHLPKKWRQRVLSALRESPTTIKLRSRSRQLPTKITEDYFTSLMITQIAKLSVRAKQLLMLDLYADKNMFLERLIDFLVNPIVGKQGFMVDVSEDSPKTAAILHRFLRFNHLHKPQKQREMVRDYLLTGEMCLLCVPRLKRKTFQLIQIPAPVVRQTIVDPGNYMQVIAVEQETGEGKTMLHKVLMENEDLLTSQAKTLRSQMEFACFLFQNKKRTYPTVSPYATSTEGEIRRYEIRGEPFLMNSADMLEALIKYIWRTMDKMESWNAFNYKFVVETSAVEREEIQEELRDWARAIGTPRPNSAIYLPKDLITMDPVAFPMHSTDLGQFYRMVRNATAWHAGTRETAMGEGDVRYASNAAPGVSEPSVETKEILQRDQMDFLREMLDFVGFSEMYRGEIPKKEFKKDSDPLELNYSIIANEISKISQEGPTKSFQIFAETAIKLQEKGLFSTESLQQAINQKGKELLAITLEEPSGKTEIGGKISQKIATSNVVEIPEDVEDLTEKISK